METKILLQLTLALISYSIVATGNFSTPQFLNLTKTLIQYSRHCGEFVSDDSVDYDSEELTSDFSLPEQSLINQRGCRLPNLPLFSEDVMKYYGKEDDLACGVRVTNTSNTFRSPLFTEDTRFLYFNASALLSYGSKHVVCVYSSFERVDGVDDNVK